MSVLAVLVKMEETAPMALEMIYSLVTASRGGLEYVAKQVSIMYIPIGKLACVSICYMSGVQFTNMY